jgi:hypothetical protein
MADANDMREQVDLRLLQPGGDSGVAHAFGGWPLSTAGGGGGGAHAFCQAARMLPLPSLPRAVLPRCLRPPTPGSEE